MFIKKCLVVALSTVLTAPFVISQEAAVTNASQAATSGGTAGTAAAGTFAGVSIATAIAVGIVGLTIIANAVDNGSGGDSTVEPIDPSTPTTGTTTTGTTTTGTGATGTTTTGTSSTGTTGT